MHACVNIKRIRSKEQVKNRRAQAGSEKQAKSLVSSCLQSKDTSGNMSAKRDKTRTRQHHA
jgi:hypothetical protein